MQVQATRAMPQIEGGNGRYSSIPSENVDLFNEIIGMMQQEGEQPSLEDDELLQSQMMVEHMMVLHPMQYVPTMFSIEEEQMNIEVNSLLKIDLTFNEQTEVGIVNPQMEQQELLRSVDRSFQEVSEIVQKMPETVQKVSETVQKVPETVQEVSETVQEISETVQEMSKTVQEAPETIQNPIESKSKVEVIPTQQSGLTEIEANSELDEKSFSKSLMNSEELVQTQENLLENLNSTRVTEFNQNISQITSEVHYETAVQKTSATVDYSGWTNQSEVVSAIEQKLVMIKENDTTKLKLKLYPQHLGAISVELNMKNGIVQASVWLDNPEAKPLIEQAFTDMNFDGSSFESLNVQINNQSKDQRDKSEDESQKPRGDLQVEAEDIIPQPIPRQRNIGLLNLKI